MLTYILTGTPGTGKTIISNYLVRKFSNKKFFLIDLNSLVKKKHLWYREDKKCKVVDIVSLKKEVLKEIEKIKKINNDRDINILIEGHLACEFYIPVDKVIVLRTRPDVLLRRLKQRGYSEQKISENIQAEVLDYCTQKAETNYSRYRSKIYEIDSSDNLKTTLNKISKILLAPKKIRRKKEKTKDSNLGISWKKYFYNPSISKYLFRDY